MFGSVVVILMLRRAPPHDVAVRNACNTFVTQYSQPATPEFRVGSHGPQLSLSFTPAVDEEADSIVKAVEAGTKVLVVYPSKTQLTSIGIENHNLVLAVESPEHARKILKLLCFTSPEDKLNLVVSKNP